MFRRCLCVVAIIYERVENVSTKNINFFSGKNLLSGTLSLKSSNNSEGRKTPFIFVLTGDGPKGSTSKTWQPVLNLFDNLGVSYFIFDFVSQGHSEGDRGELTIESGIKNLEDAVAAIHERVDFESHSIGAFGSSFGGSVILGCSSLIDKFDFLMFKSPASLLYQAYENEHNGFDEISEWLTSDISEPTGLSAKAYKLATKINLYANVPKIQVPTLIVHGTSDSIVPIEQSRRLNALLGSFSKLIELKGVNHGYKEDGASVALHSALREFLNGNVEALCGS